MNEDKGFNINNNFNVGDNVNTPQQETIAFDSYYNPKPKKTPWVTIIILVVGAIAMAISLWFAGAFTPMDRNAEYNKLYTRVCSAAITYANKNHSKAKDNPGKIVYVTVGNLINANMIEATLRNYVTNEPIPASTNIRLEVLPNTSFQCHGFVFPGDDTVKPVITLRGDPVIHVPIGTKATDPGATAIDDKDGDISDKIMRSGNVDVRRKGTYKVSYVVADISGNLSDSVERTYIVE